MVNSRDRVCKRMICFGLRFCNLIEVGLGSKVWSCEVVVKLKNQILVIKFWFVVIGLEKGSLRLL